MSKHSCTVCVTVFSTGGKFTQFRILRSYMILLKSPVLMCSWAPLNEWTIDLLLYTKTEGEGLVHFIT